MAQVQLPPRFPSTLRVDPVRTKDLFTKKVLFRGGDPAKDLYLLVDGQVAITVENTDFSYPVDEAGGVFGWSALGQSRHYTATAHLTMESTILRLDGERLMAIFEEHPRKGMLVFQRLLSVVSFPAGRKAITPGTGGRGGRPPVRRSGRPPA